MCSERRGRVARSSALVGEYGRSGGGGVQQKKPVSHLLEEFRCKADNRCPPRAHDPKEECKADNRCPPRAHDPKEEIFLRHGHRVFAYRARQKLYLMEDDKQSRRETIKCVRSRSTSSQEGRQSNALGVGIRFNVVSTSENRRLLNRNALPTNR
ncbi:hypothetical protein QE152_g10149 [Popillia japonica]|uniref:Uncharacterized protein n=1 Tax=Popillia japonica TaxID=7064 RepID=A0AAW1LSM2_POPJA